MDNKTFIIIVAIIAAAATTTIVGSIYFYNQRLKSAFENGYSEQSVYGQNGTHWVKTSTNTVERP